MSRRCKLQKYTDDYYDAMEERRWINEITEQKVKRGAYVVYDRGHPVVVTPHRPGGANNERIGG